MERKSTATISSKSQITIPAWVRRALSLQAGARVCLHVEGERLVIEPAERGIEQLEGALRDVYGDVDAYLDALREDRMA